MISRETTQRVVRRSDYKLARLHKQVVAQNRNRYAQSNLIIHRALRSRVSQHTLQGMGDKVPYHMVVNFVDTLFNCAGTVKEERRASLQVAKS